MDGIGKKLWVIAEGYIPEWSHGPEPEMKSHETFCVLNSGSVDAQLELTLYFADREPIGPVKLTAPAQRTQHIRFNELKELPVGTDFASVIRSDQPIVVQHTRLDSRQAENALMTTIAYSQ